MIDIIAWGAGCIVLFAVACFKVFVVHVNEEHQTIVRNFNTCKKHALDQGWHMTKCSERIVKIDWLWREKNRVGRREGIFIPTQIMQIKLLPVSVRSKCDTNVKVCSKIAFQIVEPLKVVEYTQPIEHMLVGTSSIVEKVVGEYKCADLYSMKTTIQERIAAEVSDYTKQLGIVCTEFIIKHF